MMESRKKKHQALNYNATFMANNIWWNIAQDWMKQRKKSMRRKRNVLRDRVLEDKHLEQISPSLQICNFLASLSSQEMKLNRENLRQVVILDPQAQGSSFNNRQFLTDIKQSSVPTPIGGQIPDSSNATMDGMFIGRILVHYNAKITTNILGGSEMRNKCGYNCGYKGKKDHFWLQMN